MANDDNKTTIETPPTPQQVKFLGKATVEGAMTLYKHLTGKDLTPEESAKMRARLLAKGFPER